jgi:hypothetical protein
MLTQKHTLEIDVPDEASEERIQTTKRRLAALWIEDTVTNDSPR